MIAREDHPGATLQSTQCQQCEGGTKSFKVETGSRSVGGRGVIRRSRGSQRPLDAREEQAQNMVLMLVGMQDVGAVVVKQIGDARNQALAVRAVNEQDGGILHASFKTKA